MSKMRVLIADELSPRAVEIFTRRGILADIKTGLSADQLAEIIHDYDGIALRSSSKVSKTLLERAKKLKVVGRAGIGVDNIDVPACSAKGVVVMNTPFGNAITTAEHSLAMIFALARQIPQAHASTIASKWEKNRFMGIELTAKTLGIIGCGNIGSILASRAAGLQMKVIAFDPFLGDERAQALGVEKVTLDDLYQRADIISLHVPMNDKTRGMINSNSIAQMKRGVLLVNCARGGLIVEEDLLAALQNGEVGGAALDVFATEPAKDNPLFAHERVVCTPHLGASTHEAQENVALQIAEQMSDYLLQGAVSNALNMPSLSAEDAIRLKPYMELARLMGNFVGQASDGAISKITLSYEGQLAGLNCKALSPILVQAVLAPRLDSINMVNAMLVAGERGIVVAETTQAKASDYQSLLRISVTNEKGEFQVAGTVVGGDKPRLVAVADVAIEAQFTTPYMLFTRNIDRPGFIGNLGGCLGKNGINIASFHLGRTGSMETAICLVLLDQMINTQLLGEIADLPNVVSAKLINFGHN